MYNQRNRNRQPAAAITEDEIKQIRHIIADSDGAPALVSFADTLGERLVREGLKANQIRAIFDEVRQIESLWLQDEEQARHKVHLLKPKLAYRAARSTEGVPTLKGVLTPAIDVVVENPDLAKERFLRFTEFFEAIIAYHKAHGGKDK